MGSAPRQSGFFADGAEGTVVRDHASGGFCPSPKRVVALMMRLLLSPYSAASAPAITSMDWIALAGMEVEKTLFRWSEMGWPSITD